jgi:predicted metal-dependent enzyme (double-stranded beta helix superfamily)
MTTFDLDRFVSDCAAALEQQDAPAAVKRLVKVAADTREATLAGLPDEGRTEIILHASEQLTVVRVACEPHRAYPPHDHQMHALIGILDGAETNTFYRRVDGDGIAATGSTTCGAGEVLALHPDAIHSVANLGDHSSVGLHVYLGDLFSLHRTIWDVETGTTFPYSDETYFRLARSSPADAGAS